MRDFEDHFSRRARTYLQHRPRYPQELYTFLALAAPHRRLALDCGTGNGQAAIGLAGHFQRVIATDASAEQISLAPHHDRVEYRVARAESSGLEGGTAALVTVAVAIHWFDFEQFYAEVRRVLSPGGLVAAWCYSLPAIDPAVDRILENFMRQDLSDYWPERFRYILERYETLPFPFEELPAPKFVMETTSDLHGILGFLQSWSGTDSYEKREGRSPLELIHRDLFTAWGNPDQERSLRWRLHMRIGQVS